MRENKRGRPKGLGPTITSWVPGESGNPLGRPKGGYNKTTIKAKELARSIVEDPEYLQNLVAAAKARKLHPAVEAMLWHYAYGKPKRLPHPDQRDRPNELVSMSTDQLAEWCENKARELRERARKELTEQPPLPTLVQPTRGSVGDRGLDHEDSFSAEELPAPGPPDDTDVWEVEVKEEP